MKASISLFGSCTSDNVFYYASMDGKNPYLVKNRFFQICPVSLMMSEPVVPLLDCEPTGRFESVLRSIKSDIQKDLFAILGKRKTDYIIVDTISFDRDILQIEQAGHIYYLSWGSEAKGRSSKVIFNMLQEANATYKVLKRNDYQEMVEESINLFCKQLLALYEPEKIILLKTYRTNFCIGSDLALDIINLKGQDNSFNDRAFQLFKKNLAGCHIIDILENMVSSYDAIYNIGVYHYDRCYYDYCLECINIITDCLSVDEEKQKLGQLKDIYSQKMTQVYETGLYHLLEKSKRISQQNSYNFFYAKQMETLQGTWLEKIRNVQGIVDQYTPFITDGKRIYQIENINEYIHLLVESGKSGYVLFFAVADTAGKYWMNFTERKTLGLIDSMEYRASYLAVADLDENNTTELYAGTEQELNYHCSIMVEDRNVLTSRKVMSMQPLLFYQVYISSKAWKFKKAERETLSWAKIMINNVDYAINRRGLNVVVFSKREHCVVDSFHVDMHADAALRIRR